MSGIMKSLRPLLMISRIFGLSIIPSDVTYSRLWKVHWSWSCIVFSIIFYGSNTVTHTSNNLSALIYAFYVIACVFSEHHLCSLLQQIIDIDHNLINFVSHERLIECTGRWVLKLVTFSTAVTFVNVTITYGFQFEWEQFKFTLLSFVLKTVITSNLCIFLATIEETGKRFDLISIEWSSALLDPSRCSSQLLERFRIQHGKLRDVVNTLNRAFALRLAIFFFLLIQNIFLFMYKYYFYGYAPVVRFHASAVFTTVLIAYAIIYYTNKLLQQSTSINDNLLITPIARLSPECQLQVRMMYYNIKNSPISITVSGHVIDSHIWPAIIMEETTYWLAAVQLKQEFVKLSTTIKLRLLNN